MKIVSTIKTGFGSARTTFIPKRGSAIVTNTKDSFVTVIDTKTLIGLRATEISPFMVCEITGEMGANTPSNS
jgi:hypothetical protein